MSNARDGFDAIAVVVDWIDACKRRRLDDLLNLYDPWATVDCCDGGRFQGRSEMERYWRPRLARAPIHAFEIDALTTDPDGVMLVEMVEELGHRVVAEAGNIRDGVALAGMAVFDFAILDINIGGYSISPVAEILAERGLPFFFVSGYGAAGRPEAYRDRPILQKPLLIAKLGEVINSILSAEIDRSGK